MVPKQCKHIRRHLVWYQNNTGISEDIQYGTKTIQTYQKTFSMVPKQYSPNYQTVFLALKKAGFRQYEDSDSKPGVGVTLRQAASFTVNVSLKRLQLQEGSGA